MLPSFTLHKWIARLFPFASKATDRTEVEHEDDDQAGLLLKDLRSVQMQKHSQWQKDASSATRTVAWPWEISTLILGVTTVMLLIILFKRDSCHDGFGAGFETDLGPAVPAIHTKRVRFNAALAYDSNGTVVIEHDPGEAVWTGDPSPQMDTLWNKFEEASGVYLHGQEADAVRGLTQLDNGYWLTGLDVFHQLHCLNQIRKALYPEYYSETSSPRVHKLHFGTHCLDYIRQAIMCNADATPVKFVYFSAHRQYGPDFRTEHTCRDINILLEWSLNRSKPHVKGPEVGAVPTIHPSL